MRVRKTTYTILYNSRNITSDVSNSLISLRYTDKVTGEADDIDISLEDKAGKWQNEWYPEKGAILTVLIHTENGDLKCGDFQVDEIEFSGPPDIVTVKAISSGYYGQSRSRKGYAHENKTLSEIVRSVAAKSGFSVVGTIENIRIGRSTQSRESDLQYLNRLAAQFGYNFSVKNKTVVFVKKTDLEARSSSLTILRSQLSGYGFKDKTSEIFKGTLIKFHNPNTNKIISANRSAVFLDQQEGYTKELPSMEIRGMKVENEEQANAVAAAYIHKKVSLQQTGSISMPGNVLMLSGNNIELREMGALSGIWHILSSSHEVSKSGYTCNADIKRVGAAVSEASKKPLKSKVKSKSYKVK